jgi:tail tube protein
MPRTGAKIGLKTQFYREHPVDSGNYSKVAEVRQIGGPTLSRGDAEATHLESPDDYEEFLPSVKSGGEVSLVLNFRPDDVSQGNSAGLLKDFEDGTIRNWKVIWPQFANSPQLVIPGYIKGWEPTTAVKDAIGVAVKIKVTGKPTPSNFA